MLLPLFATVLPTLSGAANGTEADLLSLVPRDAFLVARTAPLDTLRADLASNAWWQLLHDPALQPLCSTFDEMHGEIARELDGFDPRDLLAAVHGQVAFFVAADPAFDEPTFGILVVPGADAEPFRKLQATLRTKIGAHADAKPANHAGVGYELLVERPSSAASDAPGDDANTLAFVEHSGVVAWLVDDDEVGARAAAQGLIERLQGRAPANFGQHPGLIAARTRTHGPTRAEFFVDLAALSRKIASEAAAGTTAERVVRELGLDRLEWLHVRADVGAGENLDFEIAVKLPSDGAITTWLGALRAPSSTFLAKVPQGVAGFGAAGFDLSRLWNDVWSSFQRIDAQSTAAARQQLQAAAQGLAGIDVERDVISQFTGEFAHFAVDVPADEVGALLGVAGADTAAKDPNRRALGEVHIVGLRDPLGFEATLDGLIERFGASEMIGEEEVAGREVNFFELGQHARFSWSFGDDCVFLSPSQTALTKALEHAAKPDAVSAAQDPRFTKLIAEERDSIAFSVASTPATLSALATVLELVADVQPDVPTLADWPATVERYFKGNLTSSVRITNGEVRVQMRAR
ncbi:MAG: hypothetical protein L6Q99_00750 [Planctomycetes bacterium]|nr:hypothetical protein [Planctomycetota bacterium]